MKILYKQKILKMLHSKDKIRPLDKETTQILDLYKKKQVIIILGVTSLGVFSHNIFL